MDHIIGLKELRENFGTYEKQVMAGRSFIVMKRSKPVLMISPVDQGDWETVVDFTKFRKQGIPINELMSRLKSAS